MRRFFTILLLILYSLSISGMAIQLHYCDNNLESAKLVKDEKDKCCCPKKIKEQHQKSCCGDTKVILQLNIDQFNHYQLAQFKITNWYPNDILLNSNICFYTLKTNDLGLIKININKDVGKIKIPLYKLFKQIVYYG